MGATIGPSSGWSCSRHIVIQGDIKPSRHNNLTLQHNHAYQQSTSAIECLSANEPVSDSLCAGLLIKASDRTERGVHSSCCSTFSTATTTGTSLKNFNVNPSR